MIVRILLILLLFLPFNNQAQDYAKVDIIVKDYPKKFSSTIDLANRITADFNLDEEKVRALYQWLSINIRYDKVNAIFDIGNHRIVYSSEQDLLRQLDYKRRKNIKHILRTNKAICSGYTQVFNAVCDHLGIQSEEIVGYAKTELYQINSDAKYKNHAWNAVKINNKWQLLDVTWSTLSQFKNFKHYNNYYFFVDPKELILTHFPVDKHWQLLEKTVSKNKFFKTPIFYANYFIDDFKLTHFQNGILEVTNKMAHVYFDRIPKTKRISYSIDGEVHKPLMYKKTKNGSYVGSFKYRNNTNKNVTIYSGVLPVLSFAISSPAN